MTEPTILEVTHAQTAVITIRAQSLDPISVVLIDHATGVGSIIIECFGTSWATRWGGMGSKNVLNFVCSCEADYIVDRLQTFKMKADQTRYLVRIVHTVLAGLAEYKKTISAEVANG